MSIEFTVVVPTYNRADLIGETLQSLLSQEYPAAEIIVVDDGSTDHTADVVRAFPPPVRYIRTENRGACAARNTGVAASSFPWLALCDSDDLWRPDKLREHVSLIQACAEAEHQFSDFVNVIDGVWANHNKFSDVGEDYWGPGRRIVGPGQWLFTKPLYGRILRFQPIFPSTLVMTRRFYDRAGGFDEPLGRTLSEDLEFHLRCVQDPPSAAVAKPVVGIRKHAANFSGDPFKCELGEIKILRYALAHHRDAAIYQDILNDEMVIRSASAAAVAFRHGDLALVRELLRAVPPSRRDSKLKIKAAISGMPAGIARPLQALFTRQPARPPDQSPQSSLGF